MSINWRIVKLVLNSDYRADESTHLTFYNPKLAEAITREGNKQLSIILRRISA